METIRNREREEKRRGGREERSMKRDKYDRSDNGHDYHIANGSEA